MTERAKGSGSIDVFRVLVDKLTLIEADPSFQGIWGFLHAHGYPYRGPDWRNELADARAALGEKAGQREE